VEEEADFVIMTAVRVNVFDARGVERRGAANNPMHHITLCIIIIIM